ncbi:MAG: hypothetical protein H7Z43_03605, partial [Clostridia bacterium]|nr:hypothetical protein [Deltaproteobacteria bacterium]
GHVGGFLAGALVAYILVARDSDLVYARPPGIVTRVSAAIAGTAVVVAALLAARSVMTQTPESIVKVAKSSNTPGWMNAVAWEVARKPDAPAALVVAATDLADTIVAACQGPADCGAYRDTYATLLYRQSRFDEALESEDKALREAMTFAENEHIPADSRPDGEPSAQMARFLAARVKASGVRLNGVDANAVTVDLIGQGLRVHLAQEFPNGFVFYGILKQGSAQEGLVRITFGATRAKELEHVIPLQSAIVHGIAGFKKPQTLDIVTAWIDASNCRCAPDAYDVHFWPHDARVDGYP